LLDVGPLEPNLTVLRRSCVSMLADLFNADDPSHACGTSTIGSSEAILLGGLAMKRRWMARRKAEGKPTDNPNIVMGSEVHVRSTRHSSLDPPPCSPPVGRCVLRMGAQTACAPEAGFVSAHCSRDYCHHVGHSDGPVGCASRSMTCRVLSNLFCLAVAQVLAMI